MKRKSKSAPLKAMLAAFALAALGGCDSINWPHVYGPNEVPSSVLAEPRAVASPPAITEMQTFPRLGDVPPMPKDFTPESVTDRNKQQMENDRADAEALKRQVESEAPVE